MSLSEVHEYVSSLTKVTPDPRGSQFPLVRDGPFALISLLSSILILLKVVGPMWMKQRKPYDLRPFMLIFNGVMFGMNGAGFLITLVLTELGRNAWTCGASDPRSTDLRASAIVYLGYVYFLIKFMEFIRIGFAVLRKRDHQATMSAFIHPCLVTFVIYSGLYLYPGGIFCFLPLLDTLTNSVTYAYYVLATAKQISFEKWKKYLVGVQMLNFSLLLTHAIYFLLQPSCGVPHLVLYFQVLYGALCLSSYPFVFSKLFLGKVSSRDISPSSCCPLTQENLKLHSN